MTQSGASILHKCKKTFSRPGSWGAQDEWVFQELLKVRQEAFIHHSFTKSSDQQLARVWRLIGATMAWNSFASDFMLQPAVIWCKPAPRHKNVLQFRWRCCTIYKSKLVLSKLLLRIVSLFSSLDSCDQGLGQLMVTDPLKTVTVVFCR